MKVRVAWMAVLLIAVITFVVVRPRPSADTLEGTVTSEATAPVELVVYPSVWTVTSRNSGSNLIAVKGKSGFSGPVTVTVSGLPSTVLERYPNQGELESGKGGYYCSSHCLSASNGDFPFTLQVSDGSWNTLAPTLLPGSSIEAQTKTVTVTATANGQSVSKSFTLKLVNDEYLPPGDTGGIHQNGTADPDVIATVNNASWTANNELYKLTGFTAGTSRTRQIDVQNLTSGSKTVELISNLSSSGLSGITTELTGGPAATSLTLAANERKAVDVTISPSAATPSGVYEVLFGIKQADGSNRAGVGFAVQVTGGSSSSSSSSGSGSSTSGSGSSTSPSSSSTSTGSSSTGSSNGSSSAESTATSQVTATQQSLKSDAASTPTTTTVTSPPTVTKRVVTSQSTPVVTSVSGQTVVTPSVTPVLATAPDPLAETQILTGVSHRVSVVGTIHDATGAAVPGVTVTLDGDRHGLVTMTNQFGQFVIGTTYQAGKVEELPPSTTLSVSHPSYTTVTEIIPLAGNTPATQLTKEIGLTVNDAAARLTASTGSVGTPVTVKAEHFPAGSQLHFFWNPFFTHRDTNADGSQPIAQRGLDGGKGRNAAGALVDLPVPTVDGSGNGTAEVPPPGVPGTYILLATSDPEPTIPASTPNPGAAGYYPSPGTAVTSVTVGGSATPGASPVTDSIAQHFFGQSLGNLTAAQRSAVQNFFAPVPASITTSKPAGQPVVTEATVSAGASVGATATTEHLVGTPLPKQVYTRLREGVLFTVTTKAADGTERVLSYTSADRLPVASTLNARLVDLAKQTIDAGGTITLTVNDEAPTSLTTADLGQDLIARFLPESLETVVKVGDQIFSLTGFSREVGLQSARVLRTTERAKETLADLSQVQSQFWLPYRTPVTAFQGYGRVTEPVVFVKLYHEVRDESALQRARRNECRYGESSGSHYGVAIRGRGRDCIVFEWNTFKVWTNPAALPPGVPPIQTGDGGIVYVLDKETAKQYQENTSIGNAFGHVVTDWYESRQKAEVARLEARFAAAKGELERARVRSRELGHSITQVGVVSAPISQSVNGLGVARAEESSATEITPEQVRETNYVRVRYQGVPATLSVTDPLGRAVGINPTDGTHFEQLPGATDVGNGTGTSELFLPNLFEDEYLVTVTGVEAGAGRLTIETAAGTDDPELSSYTLALAAGETDTLTTTVELASERTTSLWSELGQRTSELGWIWWTVAILVIVVGGYRLRARQRQLA